MTSPRLSEPDQLQFQVPSFRVRLASWTSFSATPRALVSPVPWIGALGAGAVSH